MRRRKSSRAWGRVEDLIPLYRRKAAPPAFLVSWRGDVQPGSHLPDASARRGAPAVRPTPGRARATSAWIQHYSRESGPARPAIESLAHASAQHPSALRVQPQTQACLADTGATKGVARISAGLPRRTWLGSARNVSPRGVRAERRGPN